MSESDIQRILDVLAEQAKTIRSLELTVGSLSTRLEGTIDVSKLRLGFREVIFIILAVIIPAVATYYGARFSIDELGTRVTENSRLIRGHIQPQEGLK